MVLRTQSNIDLEEKEGDGGRLGFWRDLQRRRNFRFMPTRQETWNLITGPIIAMIYIILISTTSLFSCLAKL